MKKQEGLVTKIKSRFCVVWVNDESRKVMVQDVEHLREWHEPFSHAKDGGWWGDPIGASYSQWRKMSEQQRALLMLETAIDLAMQGYDLAATLREFSKVDCFRQLGSQSIPMCRALTMALLGQCLEPNTMSFEKLLVAYVREDA